MSEKDFVFLLFILPILITGVVYTIKETREDKWWKKKQEEHRRLKNDTLRD